MGGIGAKPQVGSIGAKLRLGGPSAFDFIGRSWYPTAEDALFDLVGSSCPQSVVDFVGIMPLAALFIFLITYPDSGRWLW